MAVLPKKGVSPFVFQSENGVSLKKRAKPQKGCFAEGYSFTKILVNLKKALIVEGLITQI